MAEKKFGNIKYTKELTLTRKEREKNKEFHKEAEIVDQEVPGGPPLRVKVLPRQEVPDDDLLRFMWPKRGEVV